MRTAATFWAETWTWYHSRREESSSCSHRKAFQGYLLSYELSNDFLKLRLLRCLTLSRIRLERIQCMMSSKGDAGLNCPIRTLTHLLRRQFWPVVNFPVPKRQTYPYALVTNRNRRILLALNPGFHYRLRMAISEKHSPEPDLREAA